MKMTFVVSVCMTMILAPKPMVAQQLKTYSIKSTYASTETCNYKTDGIYIVWWDKAFDYSDKATELLSTLMDVREDCLGTYRMSDPPNPLAGFYYNVYIHNPKKDLFPDDWAMGQGTDENGYPYLTIPQAYAKMGSSGAQHEGFHIFQYKANSPGFVYSGDSQWFIEATANWYAATKHPESKDEYITASAVTSNPQVTLWYSFENREAGELENWQRGCHQYGMNIFLNYLTDVRKVSKALLVGGFYGKISQLPQEYLYNQLGGKTFCDLYADFAGHNVSGYPYFPIGTEERSAKELKKYGDSLDIHPIVATYKNNGTDGEWYRPGKDFVTRGWGYNVYKINNSRNGSYTFQLQGDSAGSEGAPAEFRGRVVVRSGSSSKVYPVKMKDATTGMRKVKVKSSDSQVYLIVAATPCFFKGNQTYSYSIKIDKDEKNN
jgi:hypothetical protein